MQNNENNFNFNITFVVPTYNRINIISKTIEINKEICSRYGVQIIVIDNASEDNTYENLSISHSDVSLIRNEFNIGLKGSIKRALTEFSKANKILIFLSDEDIIFEPGLNMLLNYINNNKITASSQVLIFNHINSQGKDFWARRKRKKIKSWLDVEILSFGLISGYGFRLSDSTLNTINWEKSLDTRNTYPHWIFSFDCIDKIDVLGIPISASFQESNFSYLNEEWKSKKNHFSKSAVFDYLSFHKKHYKSISAMLFRFRYRALGALLNTESNKIEKLVSAIVFFFASPRQMMSYIVRRY